MPLWASVGAGASGLKVAPILGGPWVSEHTVDIYSLKSARWTRPVPCSVLPAPLILEPCCLPIILSSPCPHFPFLLSCLLNHTPHCQSLAAPAGWVSRVPLSLSLGVAPGSRELMAWARFRRWSNTYAGCYSPSGILRWLSPKESTCQCRGRRRFRFDSCVGKIPWRRKWQPTSVFLPGKSHGQRSMAGYSPWGCKDLTRWSVHADIILKPPTAPCCLVKHRHLGFPYTSTCFPGLAPITKLQSLTPNDCTTFPQNACTVLLYLYQCHSFLPLSPDKILHPAKGTSTTPPSPNTSVPMHHKHLLSK